jgi:hypothetical protein
MAPLLTATPNSEEHLIPSVKKTLQHDTNSRSERRDRVDDVQHMQNRSSTVVNIQLATPKAAIQNTENTPRGSSLQSQVFEGLEKRLEAILSPNKYQSWEKLISNLVRRGPKEPSVRIRHSAALRDLLGDHPEAIDLHNRFAESYNKKFVGKHERFHLPVLERLGSVKGGLDDGIGAASVQQRSKELDARNFMRVDALAMQLDGAMDIEMGSDPQPAGECEISKLTRDKMQLSESRDEENDTDQVDIEMQDSQSELKGTTPNQVSSGSVVIQPAPENIAGLETSGVPNAAQAEIRMEIREQQQGTSMSDKNTYPTRDLPLVAIEGYRVAAIDPTAPVAKKDTAQSYLAWLNQRQTRFPIAAPNYSECVSIAGKLERPPGYVYDEILHHWGFETDSRWGEWYRQNRSMVLGEDPRFDDETMGKWEAWLKEGWDLMSKKQ